MHGSSCPTGRLRTGGRGGRGSGGLSATPPTGPDWRRGWWRRGVVRGPGHRMPWGYRPGWGCGSKRLLTPADTCRLRDAPAAV